MFLALLFACTKTVEPQLPSPSTPPAPIAASAPTASVEPTWRGDRCATDADCAWDDPCMPSRCGKGVPSAANCDESAPAPGDCSCVEHMCTNRWKDDAAGASAPGCTADADCAVDIGTGTCHLHGNTMVGPITSEGALCRCDTATTQCVRQWVAPIACTSFKDCGFERVPRLHPIKPVTPRDHPVKMCEEGSVDAVCGKDGVCATVIAGC